MGSSRAQGRGGLDFGRSVDTLGNSKAKNKVPIMQGSGQGW